MNRARAYINDAFRGGQGRILTNTAPFTVEYLNGALEELQDKIGNNGVITLTADNIILGPILPVSGGDPTTQIGISYNGMISSGETDIPNVALPVLPSNIVSVEDLGERQVGSGLPFQPMFPVTNGLPSVLQGPWLTYWEYRQDAIWFTGSTQTEEIRLRGQIRQVPVAPEDAPDLDNVEIGILASINALATLVAYNYARARGAAQAQVMQADAEKQMRYIVRRYTRRAQRIPYRRAGYGNAGDRRGVSLPF